MIVSRYVSRRPFLPGKSASQVRENWLRVFEECVLSAMRIDAVSVVTAPSERSESRMVVDEEHRAQNWCSNDTAVAEEHIFYTFSRVCVHPCASSFLTSIPPARRRFETTSNMRRQPILRTRITVEDSIARAIRGVCTRNHCDQNRGSVCYEDGATCRSICSSILTSALDIGPSWPWPSVSAVCFTSTMKLSISWHMVSSENITKRILFIKR